MSLPAPTSSTAATGVIPGTDSTASENPVGSPPSNKPPTAIADEESPNTQILRHVDTLFKSVNSKDTMTIGEIYRSVASYFGWAKVEKEQKKMIKNRLISLMSADAEDKNEKASTAPSKLIDLTVEGEEPTTKRRRVGDEENEDKFDIDSLFRAVATVLSPPNDPSFARQEDYLHTLFRSQSFMDDSKPFDTFSSWKNLSCAISGFLSYYMIRKVWGEDEEGLRSAAKAMYNLIHHCRHTNFINVDVNIDPSNDYDRLLAYTTSLAEFPYEVASALQNLWDTFYWEKREEAYTHLRKSKFTLEPGDYYTKLVDDDDDSEKKSKSVDVLIKESDMIMTKGDINKIGGSVSIYLAIARLTGDIFRDRGLGCSTSKHRVRGQDSTIYCGLNAKEEAYLALEDYRANDRKYEKNIEDEFGGRIEIKQVCKNGWWMASAAYSYHGSGVFVPLTAKVAKMGMKGTEFSGMRLALAGGVWRPIPAEENFDSHVCYNVYPPGIHAFEQREK